MYAIRSYYDVVLSGKTYIGPGIAGTVMEGFLDGRRNRKLKSKTAWDSLTQREREVLKLVAEGYTSKEVAGFPLSPWAPNSRNWATR